jgi:hypothetical protein
MVTWKGDHIAHSVPKVTPSCSVIEGVPDKAKFFAKALGPHEWQLSVDDI